MNDLRGTIKDLQNVARRLEAATFNPDMSALKSFVDKLDTQSTTATPPEDVRRKTLEKFLRGEEDFTPRELRSLPFIIHEDAITLDDVKKILNRLELDNKRHLSGLVNVYLNRHDGSPKTELLRRRLYFIPPKFSEGSSRLRKVFAARDRLFGDNRLSNTVRLLADKLSVAASLEELGLTNFFKASQFIQDALKLFFRSEVSLAAQFKLLEELDSDFDTYKNIFPAIADAMIQSVFRAGFGKEQCLSVFYRRLGDPRFGDSRFKWHGVSQRAIDIFSHWLSEQDLEIFFELIRQTAVDRMWRYREKFWRAYLPYIAKTKIFLGKQAQVLAAQIRSNVQLRHGELRGAVASQSVFVFQIGRYIFSEWSHNGKLRVQREESQINLFGVGDGLFENSCISRDVLVHGAEAEWIHSSSETYFWQREVSAWLKAYCGIDKTEKDWRL